MTNTAETGIDPRELGLESAIETEPENEIMETARQGRTAILMEAIKSRSAEVWSHPVIQKAVNHAPLVGDALMGYKLATGKEAGRKLTGREKFLYGASIATSLAGIYYLSQGELTTAGLSSAMSEYFTHLDTGISLFGKAAEKIKDAKPELANFVMATADLIASKKETFLKLKNVFDQSIIQLDLQ